MDCPKCHQSATPVAGSTHCPLCGFDLGPVHQRLRTIYLVSFGFFMSTVVYGATVWLLEHLNGFQTPATAPPAALAYALLAIGVIDFGLATHILRRRALLCRDPAQLQTLMIIRLALAEAIVILGLVLYFVGRSVEWFAVFMALGFVAFLLIAFSMPQVARRMGELVVAETDNAAPR
ncbi:MAG: hypothetical protein HPY69_12020 [Armatimonadetes bacterium]|nr:hypothetical protein [Armatimonadota bacterium]